MKIIHKGLAVIVLPVVLQLLCILWPAHVKACNADQGAGIAKDEQKRLFDKYYQVDSADSLKGFGLGLAICHVIIAEHGGELGVESKVGEGSTFWFKLPLDKG